MLRQSLREKRSIFLLLENAFQVNEVRIGVRLGPRELTVSLPRLHAGLPHLLGHSCTPPIGFLSPKFFFLRHIERDVALRGNLAWTKSLGDQAGYFYRIVHERGVWKKPRF